MKYQVRIDRPTYRNIVPFESLFGANYFASEANRNVIDAEYIEVANAETGEIFTAYVLGKLTFKAEE